jgi:hypothetical protein
MLNNPVVSFYQHLNLGAEFSNGKPGNLQLALTPLVIPSTSEQPSG